MLIIISFTYYSDLVYIPDTQGYKPKKLQKQFDKWINNKAIEHDYWVYKDGEKYGVSFDTDAFIKWLNDGLFFNIDDKAKIIEKNISNIFDNIDRLYF